ncbi:vWA domain-containing protein [Haloplanus rubicundus]|uniref:VWA domain-containing protein n=1 Tax=Haloplanus rubicundus TaxID=1547898 RepID=A0A345EIJ5_9EURY|nr:vWA domain-containing protein [Haloplanus rubicundus]AXG12017.1 VWA domain-containing protein [Haloplanus rubicundus]
MSVHRHQVTDDLKPNAAVRSRISPQRADRLREFILGHLPRGVTVDVVISSSVQTAAVLPVDVDAIVSSDATEIERAQAEQLLAGVDTDYLVMVTGTEADLTRIPLNDQLTADHAHQFGLAFHELLHILKTAITAISELLETEVDVKYHAQVHDLINIVEDGAIESEAIHGENFSDNAGIRLELTRRLHSQTPEDIPDDEHVRYSFWDAVTSCLYDEAIYPTGTTEVLLNKDDSRVQFKSEADRDAFRAIHSELCMLSDDGLAIRSADRSDITHDHDKTASIRRSRRVIKTWTDHIQPVLEADEDPRDAEGDAGTGEDSQGRLQSNSPTQLPKDFDPGDVSLSQEATSDPRQNVFEQPQVTADPDPTDIDEEAPSSGEGAQERDGGGRHEDGEGASEERADAGQKGGDGTSGEEEFKDKAESGNNEQSESDSDPPSRAQAIAQAADRARQREQEHQGTNPSQETNSPETEAPSKSPSPVFSSGDVPKSVASSSTDTPQQDQLTFGEFGADSQDNRENTNPNTSEDEIGDGPSVGETDDERPSDGLDEAGQSNQTEPPTPETASSSAAGDTDTGARSESESGSEPEAESDSESGQDIPEGPAHAESSTRSPDEDEATYENALAGDERAAHGESEREDIDEQALEEELSALADQLERSARQQAQNGEDQNNGEGGQQGALGSLEDLDILPISDDLAHNREWGAIEEGADRVADTLEMYLRLDRRKNVRRGLSSGAYDSRAGHRLAIGDPRVCKSRTLGDEKQYALVLVLDRSGSMRRGSPPKIEIATQALARFALAAENLGIRVAITDFYRGEARLVKPFSIDTRHVQANLLDTTCGGGTPLSDAVSLARELVEAQRDEPLIITVTDGNPASMDDVIDQIRRSHAPVCSLTIATDCQPGSLSDSASELSRYYERQEAVYTPERLDDRLDQFASLLAGL